VTLLYVLETAFAYVTAFRRCTYSKL